jgi:hypothetical protein
MVEKPPARPAAISTPPPLNIDKEPEIPQLPPLQIEEETDDGNDDIVLSDAIKVCELFCYSKVGDSKQNLPIFCKFCFYLELNFFKL